MCVRVCMGKHVNGRVLYCLQIQRLVLLKLGLPYLEAFPSKGNSVNPFSHTHSHKHVSKHTSLNTSGTMRPSKTIASVIAKNKHTHIHTEEHTHA